MPFDVEFGRLLVLQRVHAVTSDVLRGNALQTETGQFANAQEHEETICAHVSIAI